MPIRSSSLAPLAAAMLALAGCGGDEPARAPERELDPAIVAALADPIMIDPDLASQNRGNAAITLDAFDAVPLEDVSPEAVQAAKADAARLAGGMIRTAPPPLKAQGAVPPALTAGEVAAALPQLGPNCAAALRYDYAWAALLPQAIPIYPRGHVQEAAGSDLSGCALRAAIFVTPVERSDVVDFYHTVAENAGYRTRHRRHGDVDVLSGTSGASGFVVRVREVSDDLTAVELAVRR